MKYFFYILLQITFISCGGGDSSITNITNSESQQIGVDTETESSLIISNIDFSGEYAFAYEPGDNSRIVIYLKLEGDSFIGRVYTFPFKGDLTIANFTENIGKMKNLGDGRVEVTYSKETCNEVGSETFSIEGDPKTSILVTYENTTFRLANNNLLQSIDLNQIGMLTEDVSCKNILPVTTTTTMSSGDYSGLLSQVQCRSGSRLSNIYTFSSSNFSGTSATTISGTFNSGGIGGTSVSREYVGVGYYGDVMIVQKVTSGSQVIGYNVLLSMCSMSSTNGAPYVSDSRLLSNFSGTITLNDEVSCGHGMIDASQTTMQSQVDPNYSYLPVFQVDTWFTKVGCVSY